MPPFTSYEEEVFEENKYCALAHELRHFQLEQWKLGVVGERPNTDLPLPKLWVAPVKIAIDPFAFDEFDCTDN